MDYLWQGLKPASCRAVAKTWREDENAYKSISNSDARVLWNSDEAASARRFRLLAAHSNLLRPACPTRLHSMLGESPRFAGVRNDLAPPRILAPNDALARAQWRSSHSPKVLRPRKREFSVRITARFPFRSRPMALCQHSTTLLPRPAVGASRHLPFAYDGATTQRASCFPSIRGGNLRALFSAFRYRAAVSLTLTQRRGRPRRSTRVQPRAPALVHSTLRHLSPTTVHLHPNHALRHGHSPSLSSLAVPRCTLPPKPLLALLLRATACIICVR
jgi:hypothetical protein